MCKLPVPCTRRLVEQRGVVLLAEGRWDWRWGFPRFFDGLPLLPKTRPRLSSREIRVEDGNQKRPRFLYKDTKLRHRTTTSLSPDVPRLKGTPRETDGVKNGYKPDSSVSVNQRLKGYQHESPNMFSIIKIYTKLKNLSLTYGSRNLC